MLEIMMETKTLMLNTSFVKKSELGQLLYLLPFLIFLTLINLRNSESYSFIFTSLPVLGRTMPFFILTLLLTLVYKLRGGNLSQLGLCWPHYPEKLKRQVFIRIVLLALSIFALRIFFAVVSDPITDMFPSIPRENLLHNNIDLLIGLLPVLWLVVIAEEVLFRGLLMNYLAKLFGNTAKAWVIAIILSAIVFGLGHMGKGPGAAIGSGLGGLAYGIGYYYSRKNLWPVIVAHCAVNTIGFIGAYFG